METESAGSPCIFRDGLQETLSASFESLQDLPPDFALSWHRDSSAGQNPAPFSKPILFSVKYHPIFLYLQIGPTISCYLKAIGAATFPISLRQNLKPVCPGHHLRPRRPQHLLKREVVAVTRMSMHEQGIFNR
jgi:hypothetical protein